MESGEPDCQLRRSARGLQGLYVVNWVYKYSRLGYIEWIATISGIIQTLLYADFFYYYAISKYHGNKNVSLPK